MSTLKFINSENVETGQSPVIAVAYMNEVDGGDLVTTLHVDATIQLVIFNQSRQEYWNGAGYQANTITLNMTAADTDAYVYTGLTLSTTAEEVFLLKASVSNPAGNGVNPPTVSARQVLRSTFSLSHHPVADTAFGVGDVVDTLGELLSVLKLVNYNNQEINDLSKRLIHYKNDGVTPGMEFNLKDAQGNLSAREVFKKELA